MKKLFLLIIIAAISCKAQKRVTGHIGEEQRKVLLSFFNSQKPYTYIDKNVQKIDRVRQFVGRYKKARSLFTTADKVCSTSENIEERKFYCPIADSFSTYSDLLSDEDLSFIIEKYSTLNTFLPQELPLDSLLGSNINNLKKHSEVFYREIDYSRYDGNPDIDEYPSLRIYGCLFNQNKTVAIIPYNNINRGLNHGRIQFFLLKKMDGIWWKPLGPLKL